MDIPKYYDLLGKFLQSLRQYIVSSTITADVTYFRYIMDAVIDKCSELRTLYTAQTGRYLSTEKFLQIQKIPYVDALDDLVNNLVIFITDSPDEENKEYFKELLQSLVDRKTYLLNQTVVQPISPIEQEPINLSHEELVRLRQEQLTQPLGRYGMVGNRQTELGGGSALQLTAYDVARNVLWDKYRSLDDQTSPPLEWPYIDLVKDRINAIVKWIGTKDPESPITQAVVASVVANDVNIDATLFAQPLIYGDAFVLFVKQAFAKKEGLIRLSTSVPLAITVVTLNETGDDVARYRFLYKQLINGEPYFGDSNNTFKLIELIQKNRVSQYSSELGNIRNVPKSPQFEIYKGLLELALQKNLLPSDTDEQTVATVVASMYKNIINTYGSSTPHEIVLRARELYG